MQLSDTIVALATPAGRSGIGVVRVSGPNAVAIVARMVGLEPPPSLRSWAATLAEIKDSDGNPVDQVIVTYFQAPRSYTAEDVVEIACHGSPIVLAFCVDSALRAGARLAEPGEFTLRAFANGRIDLPRAEAIRDLIDATTIYQAKIACQQADGSLARQLRPVKEQLLALIAELEAGIDFAEDATSEIDVPGADSVLPVLDRAESAVRGLADSYSFGRYVRDGVHLAIAGRPNVGKSSLFNALLERERAIVTEIPGTTRDVIGESASIGGIPIRLMDTAGIRSSIDQIERLGIERSYAAIADADLAILVLDLSQPLGEEDLQLLERVQSAGPHLVVGNKSDLACAAEPPFAVLPVSARTRDGISQLQEAIVALLSPDEGIPAEQSLITNARHAGLLRQAADALAKGRQAQTEGLPHEMLLLDLYSALRYLDELSGATTADDILNRIFNSFCIGK